MDAIVLVGGKGTRLQHVVGDRPKPMAPVGGRPFLEWILLALRRQGLQRVVLSTGHMGEAVQRHFRDGSEWGLDLAYACDPFPLGTGGAVRHALAWVKSDRLVVLNGDSYCHFDLIRLQEIHISNRARATIWLVPVEDSARYGTVEIDSQGMICSFQEKTNENVPGLINGGVYLFERDIAISIPEGRSYSLEMELLPKLVGQGLYGVVGDGRFLDIGTPESYEMAECFFRRADDTLFG